MALFFDQDWFSARLAERQADKAMFAEALGVSAEVMAMIWKDQRALDPDQVRKAARFLDISEGEIIKYAGIATPRKPQTAEKPNRREEDIALKLDRIERQLTELKHMVMSQNLPKSF